MVAGRGDVPGGAAEPGDHQHVAAIGEERLTTSRRRRGKRLAARRGPWPSVQSPWRRSRPARSARRPGIWPSNAITPAARTVSSARPPRRGDARSCRKARACGRCRWPMCSCHGLNSPHSPRMVISISSGKRQAWVSESMLMQLPTPLLCIRRTPRWPPSQPPASSATPSSSVVSGTLRMPGSAAQSVIRRACPASGT